MRIFIRILIVSSSKQFCSVKSVVAFSIHSKNPLSLKRTFSLKIRRMHKKFFLDSPRSFASNRSFASFSRRLGAAAPIIMQRTRGKVDAATNPSRFSIANRIGHARASSRTMYRLRRPNSDASRRLQTGSPFRAKVGG